MKTKNKLLTFLACMLFVCVASAGATAAFAAEPDPTPDPPTAEEGTWEYAPADFRIITEGAKEDLTMTVNNNAGISSVTAALWSIPSGTKPPAGTTGKNTLNEGNKAGVQKTDGVKYYLYFNGTRYDQLDAKVYTFNIHMRNVNFGVYADGYTFKDGDTFEFRRGMYFPLAVDDGVDIAGYWGRLNETFTMKRLAGQWVTYATAGTPTNVVDISEITAEEAGMTTAASYNFTISFDLTMSDNALENLEEIDNYAANIFIGDKSVKEINAAAKKTVARVSANGTGITVKADQDAGIVRPDQTIAVKVAKEFLPDSGMLLENDQVRYYIPKYGYWSTVAPYEIEKTVPVTVSTVYTASGSPDFSGATNRIDILFNEDIAAGSMLGYGGHPRQLLTLTGPFGITQAMIDAWTSSGALASLIDHVQITTKSGETTVTKTMAQYYEEASGFAQTWSLFECYVRNAKNLSFSSSNFINTTEYTVTLKAGLTFYSGAYLDHDVVIAHSASGDNAVTVACTALALEADNTDLMIGDKAQLTLTKTPVATTDEITIDISDDSILSVDENGVITALKAGTATVQASARSGAVKSNALTVTVRQAVTGISVAEPSVSLKAGETKTITVTFAPAGASDAVEFSSDAPAVATVDQTGKITAVAAGTATITVTSGDYTATVTVTVTAETSGGTGEDTEDKGCGSAAIGGVAALTVLFGAVAAVVILRKKRAV